MRILEEYLDSSAIDVLVLLITSQFCEHILF